MASRSHARAADAPPDRDVELRLAARLARLRAERGWSLDGLAERTGISRATLSRLERGELSPTASMLGRLCTVFGWTLSRLMAEAETRAASLVEAAAQAEWTDPASGYRRRMVEQPEWRDPESGYRRRAVSPPAPGLRGELVEVRLPAGATVTFETSPVPGLEHHLWVLEGSLTLEVEGTPFALHAGDCLRYVLHGPTRFTTGRRAARYAIAMVHP
jgi:transcriptional regulator with XRE-family HTH domain